MQIFFLASLFIYCSHKIKLLGYCTPNMIQLQGRDAAIIMTIGLAMFAFFFVLVLYLASIRGEVRSSMSTSTADETQATKNENLGWMFTMTSHHARFFDAFLRLWKGRGLQLLQLRKWKKSSFGFCHPAPLVTVCQKAMAISGSWHWLRHHELVLVLYLGLFKTRLRQKNPRLFLWWCTFLVAEENFDKAIMNETQSKESTTIFIIRLITTRIYVVISQKRYHIFCSCHKYSMLFVKSTFPPRYWNVGLVQANVSILRKASLSKLKSIMMLENIVDMEDGLLKDTRSSNTASQKTFDASLKKLFKRLLNKKKSNRLDRRSTSTVDETQTSNREPHRDRYSGSCEIMNLYSH